MTGLPFNRWDLIKLIACSMYERSKRILLMVWIAVLFVLAILFGYALALHADEGYSKFIIEEYRNDTTGVNVLFKKDIYGNVKSIRLQNWHDKENWLDKVNIDVKDFEEIIRLYNSSRKIKE
jgi:hypothetical protein